MYGYRTKHKILAYYMDQIKGVPPPKIRLTKYAKSVKGVNENVVATYLLDMKLEGYVTFYDVPPPEHDQDIEITNDGIAAFIGRHFYKKEGERFWKSFMNIAMTLANVLVAVVAVWALSKGDSELQRLKERLQKIESGEQAKEGAANPNTQPTQSSGQSISKTDLKKTSSFYLDTFYIGVDTIYK